MLRSSSTASARVSLPSNIHFRLSSNILRTWACKTQEIGEFEFPVGQMFTRTYCWQEVNCVLVYFFPPLALFRWIMSTQIFYVRLPRFNTEFMSCTLFVGHNKPFLCV
jgi:hypothetical protein